jgi:1,4-dihydroxy-2-naphthoyl-CoA hydrolase
MDDATAFLHRTMPLCATLGVRSLSQAPEAVELALDWDESLCTSGGLLHGGAVMTLADSAGAACAFFNLPEGAGTSTIESKTNFLGGVTGGTITATARPLHVGGTTIAVETEVRDGDGRLIAKTTQTQIVLRPR